MKTIYITLIIGCLTISLSAQDINVTFSPAGNTNLIDSIQATNLRTKQSVIVPGDGTLTLGIVSSIQTTSKSMEGIDIFPNPFSEKATISSFVPTPQEIKLGVRNILTQAGFEEHIMVPAGRQGFELQVNQPGLYLVYIRTNEGIRSTKVINTNSTGEILSIKPLGLTLDKKSHNNTPDFKSSSAYHLGYSRGDVMHYKCFSRNMTTILTDTLPRSRNYLVEFHECTDPNDRNYPIVKIGELTWMAENLAFLPYVNRGSATSDRSPHYYVAGYDGSNVDDAMEHPNYTRYGVLYNWPAALVSCPAGWHLPSDEEWKIMEMQLGMSQEDADAGAMEPRLSGEVGRKLKSSLGWENEGNGDNSSGFTAVPGGMRNEDGNFYEQGYSVYMWTNSEVEDTKAWGRSLYDYNNEILRGYTFRRMGFVVRCVKNQ